MGKLNVLQLRRKALTVLPSKSEIPSSEFLRERCLANFSDVF
jgi:hypothetical protein